MRQLRVVGLSDDGRQLLLAPAAKSEPTHRVAIDDRLRAAARGDLARFGGALPDSSLSPREIQARLRAGETPEALAKAAGVPVSRVERFSGPVVSERARIVDEARAAHMTRSRRAPSALALGDCVDAALRTVVGLRPESVDWTARRREDGSWLVGLEYAARGGRRRATWAWDPAARSVSPVDAMAARLGYAGELDGAPPRRRKRAGKRAAPAPTRKATTAKRTAKRTAKKTAKKVASPRKAAPPRKVANTAAKRVTPPVAPVPSWDEVLLGVKARPRRRSRA